MVNKKHRLLARCGEKLSYGGTSDRQVVPWGRGSIGRNASHLSSGALQEKKTCLAGARRGERRASWNLWHSLARDKRLGRPVERSTGRAVWTGQLDGVFIL